MQLADHFRDRAGECRKLAENAATLAARAYWSAMAQLWLDLAAHLDATHASSERSTAFAPLTPREAPSDGAA